MLIYRVGLSDAQIQTDMQKISIGSDCSRIQIKPSLDIQNLYSRVQPF